MDAYFSPSTAHHSLCSGSRPLPIQFPITALREVRLLKGMQHPNIVRLREVVTGHGTLAPPPLVTMPCLLQQADHVLFWFGLVVQRMQVTIT